MNAEIGEATLRERARIEQIIGLAEARGVAVDDQIAAIVDGTAFEDFERRTRPAPTVRADPAIIKAERERVVEIFDEGETSKRPDLAAHAISAGWSLATFKSALTTTTPNRRPRHRRRN